MTPVRRRFHALMLVTLCGTGCAEAFFRSVNTPPKIAFEVPEDGMLAAEGDVLELRVVVQDKERALDELSVTWTSDLDGDVGSATHPNAAGTARIVVENLSIGTHVLRARVADPDGLTAEAERTVEIENLPNGPEINVLRPESNAGINEGDLVLVHVHVQDKDEPDPRELTVEATSTNLGTVCEARVDGFGDFMCLVTFLPGMDYLEFTVTDPAGKSATGGVAILVTGLDQIDNDGDKFTETGNRFGQGLVDCDDHDALRYPAAEELCDGIDNDCDGTIDEGTACFDDDGDGLAEIGGDCNDANGAISPNGQQLYPSPLDQDCDGDNGEDQDGDGYDLARDCDDTDPHRSPGLVEVCNGFDDDCDEVVDEVPTYEFYADQDGDGFGNPDHPQIACMPPGPVGSLTYPVDGSGRPLVDDLGNPFTRWVYNDGDCYDYNRDANPLQSGFFGVERGSFRKGNMWDYDCTCDRPGATAACIDKTQRDDASVYRCEVDNSIFDGSVTTGWSGNAGWWNGSGALACGDSRIWATGCNYHMEDLGLTYVLDNPTWSSQTTLTQECR